MTRASPSPLTVGVGLAPSPLATARAEEETDERRAGPGACFALVRPELRTSSVGCWPRAAPPSYQRRPPGWWSESTERRSRRPGPHGRLVLCGSFYEVLAWLATWHDATPPTRQLLLLYLLPVQCLFVDRAMRMVLDTCTRSHVELRIYGTNIVHV